MIFVCDLDGTIAELTPEQEEFVNKIDPQKEGMTWDKDYYAHLMKQKPIQKNVEVALLFRKNVDFYFITGRSEKYRKETEEWLAKFVLNNEMIYTGIKLYLIKRLKMRQEDDFRPSHEVKEDLYKGIIKDMGWKPLTIAFEDDPDCQIMYKNEGCFILQPD